MGQENKGGGTSYLKKIKYNDRIRLKTGTFLHAYCPKCSRSLIKEKAIMLTVVNKDGTKGRLGLSPYLNAFDHKSDINIPSGMELEDLQCPHCRQSLVYPDVKCDSCDGKTAKLLIAAVNQRVPFLICIKEGCKWHSIKPEDEEILIKDISDEW